MSNSKRSTTTAIVIMIAAVLAPYFVSHIRSGNWRLLGSDYETLHRRRIDYARESFRTRGELPGWYSRELAGSPFWSNVQNFPFIPTRIVVLLFDGQYGLTVGSELAAVLAALFTFLFARRIGLGRTGAVAAGWTFASAGYFVVRIRAGHLPLLEAYPALPLLLWLVERGLVWRPEERVRFGARLFATALACCCVMLAGHPQLPFYAIVAAVTYAVYRCRTRRVVWMIGAIVLGVALAGFSIWPMTKLILRSTRVMNLERAANDVALPYSRIGAAMFPWKDGWPNGQGSDGFVRYPGPEYFWDTVSYVGWLPLIASAGLLLRGIVRRQWPSAPWSYLIVLGIAALLLSLPASRVLMEALPGTFLRSPSRLLYFTTFALALGLGAAAQLALDSRRRLLGGLGVGTVLAAHFWDLSWHNHYFLEPSPQLVIIEPWLRDGIVARVGEGRLGLDISAQVDINRRVDDAGFFDSIMLASSHRGLLDLNGWSERLNIQNANAFEYSPRALAAFGTKLVASFSPRTDLPRVPELGPIFFYNVPQVAPRAEFFADADIRVLPKDQLHQRLRDSSFDLSATLLLPGDRNGATLDPRSHAHVSYKRISPDVIEVEYNATGSGYVRVLEAHDVGWRATVDGMPAPIVAGNDMFLAVRVEAGTHRVRFEFHTPGVKTGIAVSVWALAAIVGLAYTSRP